jgi:hypothetical protein
MGTILQYDFNASDNLLEGKFVIGPRLATPSLSMKGIFLFLSDVKK